MNRVVVFGVAIFFAIVGIALLGGGERKAVAGHGCSGCSGCHGCDGGACKGADACNGCHGRVKRDRCHGRTRCHGSKGCTGCNGCNGKAAYAPAQKGGAEQKGAAQKAADASFDEAPLAFRRVIFRRY